MHNSFLSPQARPWLAEWAVPRWRCLTLTVIGDVGHLESFAAVGLVGFELDPELAGAGGKGDGPLIGLARLVGGDRRG